MKKALLAAAGLAFAAIAMAQLSKYKDWSKSAEAYFLTPSEKDAWSKVRTDDEAAKFIADYWAKRDPNPATSANEFRDEVGRRIAAAENGWTYGQMELVHQSVAKQRAIQLAAAFAEQPFHFPLPQQPLKCCGKINFIFTKDLHGVGDGAESI